MKCALENYFAEATELNVRDVNEKRHLPYFNLHKNMKQILFLLLLIPIFFTGCANVEIKPLQKGVTKIYMIENPAVIVPDFTQVVTSEFNERGIKIIPIPARLEPGIPKDAFYMKYTARRSWDIVPYMAEARIDIYQNSYMVAYLNYYYNFLDKFSLLKREHPSKKLKQPFKDFFINY